MSKRIRTNVVQKAPWSQVGHSFEIQAEMEAKYPSVGQLGKGLGLCNTLAEHGLKVTPMSEREKVQWAKWCKQCAEDQP